MARVSPIQETFNAGEISRSVRGRVSSEIYRAGLKSALNWMPIVQGPIRLRNGSKFLSTVDTSNWTPGNTSNVGIRTFTFRRILGSDVLIEIGEGKVVAKDAESGSSVIGGQTGDLIPNPNWRDNLDQWAFPQDARAVGADPGAVPIIYGILLTIPGPWLGGTEDVYWNYFVPAVGSPVDGYKPGAMQTGTAGITFPAGTETEQATFKTRWQIATNDDGVARLGGETTMLADWKWRVDIGSTQGGNDIFTGDYTAVANNVWNEETINFTPGVSKVFVTFGIVYTGVDIPAQATGIFCRIGRVSMVGQYPSGSGQGVEFTSPWDAAQLECLNYAFDPGEGIMVFTHEEVPPYVLQLSDTGEWSFQRLDNHPDYQNPNPNTWVLNNWPRACAFHEGRLWLAGSNQNPQTVWASRSGDYYDFGNSVSDSKDDPLLFPLSSAGNIQTLTSRKDLVINTDISEVIGTSDLGVIAFDDFSFPKQTDWGSNCIQPVVVGRQMVFTSNSRRILRTFADEGGTNYGYDGVELNLLAEDIFRTPVRQMAFMDEPSYQAAFLLGDGTLGMATFYYPENIIGWWRLKTAYNGSETQSENRIMSIAAIDMELGSKLWLTVNRAGWAGTQYPTHEQLSFDRDSITALDSYVVRTISPTGQITDIDHLTDQEISIVVEQSDRDTGETYWTVHPEGIVPAAGIASGLEEWSWGAQAYVGLKFENNFQLLPVEGVSQRGTSQVTKRRWNQVYLRLNNSAIPLVDGEPAADRTPSTPMGLGEPIISDDIEYSQLGSGKGDLLITQDKPLITEVVAIFGKVTAEEI